MGSWDKIYALADELGERLLANQLKVTTAESCTGGGVAFAITSVPGSSSWFESARVTYSNQAKISQLDVLPSAVASDGVVSKSVVEQMSVGACLAANADCSIAISGIAGPDGGSDEKPVGLVWFGFCIEGQVYAESQTFDGGRAAIRLQSIEFALKGLLRRI